MSFPRYESYKDSGVKWLGEVPKHWDMKRLKQVCEVFPSNVDKKTYENDPPALLCNYTDVYYNEQITPHIDFMTATASADQIKKFTLREGDTIITKDSETADDIAIAAYVPHDLPGVICGYHLSMVRPREVTCGAFVKRLFDSIYVKSCCHVSANGLTRVGLGQYALDNLEVPFPPKEEQVVIAAFIDRETAKIDELVSEQKNLIELLKEKRQAVISHSVTKGLNPAASMKNSGIEWLGKVPEHWGICALKRMTKKVTDGAHISPETENGIYEFVSTKDVRDDGIDFENCLRTSEASYEYLVRTGCKPSPGDVLFSKDGTIGRTVVVRENRDFVVASSLIIIKPDSEAITPDFLNYLCQSSVVVGQVESFVKGAGLPRLSIQNLLKIVGVFPPLTEQRLIVDHLNLVLGQMASLLISALETITLLQEHRTALISAAVTGKIDVRGLVSAKPEVEQAA